MSCIASRCTRTGGNDVIEIGPELGQVLQTVGFLGGLALLIWVMTR